MFYESQFNGDISSWNTGNVPDISGMFYDSPLEDKESEWFTDLEKRGQKRLQAWRRAEEREQAEAMKEQAELQEENKKGFSEGCGK